MAEDVVVEQSKTSGNTGEYRESGLVKFLRATEVDTRLLGMIGALLLIWVGFHFYGHFVNGFGAFLTPRNLWNLSVQTSSIAVMATGMVLIIVTRHIDLSVGSMLGFVAMIMGVVQVWVLPDYLGLGHPLTWIITVLVGIALGALIGAFQGYLIAYLAIPAFIVTLGGLLIWRGSAYLVARGETIAPVDATFSLIGGGPFGTIGATWSWILGIVVSVGIIALLYSGRMQRIKFQFPTRPMWAEYLIGGVGIALVMGSVLVMNAYPWPKGIVRRYAEANSIELTPEGLFISHGYAIPVLIALMVGAVMTFITTRTPVRPLRVRHWRQSRSGRTGGYQHQENDAFDFLADGRVGWYIGSDCERALEVCDLGAWTAG